MSSHTHWSIRNETYFWGASFRNLQCLGMMQYSSREIIACSVFSLLWHWSWLDRRAIIIIVLTTLCLIEFTHFSNERCIEVENRGKMHFGVLENVRCSKVYVVKCTFYWGLIYKDKEGKKRELAKMHLIARKTLYWGTLYQGSTVYSLLSTIHGLC